MVCWCPKPLGHRASLLVDILCNLNCVVKLELGSGAEVAVNYQMWENESDVARHSEWGLFL